MNTFQVNFRPAASKIWKKDAKRIIKILTSGSPKIVKSILLHPSYKYIKIVLWPFLIFLKLLALIFRRSEDTPEIIPLDGEDKTADQTKDILENPDKIDPKFLAKLTSEAYEVDVNIICA